MHGCGDERVIRALTTVRMNGAALIAALPFIIKQQIEDEIYRRYIADGLRMLTEGVAGQASAVLLPWADVIAPQPEEAEDDRTGAEIAADILLRLRREG